MRGLDQANERHVQATAAWRNAALLEGQSQQVLRTLDLVLVGGSCELFEMAQEQTRSARDLLDQLGASHVAAQEGVALRAIGEALDQVELFATLAAGPDDLEGVVDFDRGLVLPSLEERLAAHSFELLNSVEGLTSRLGLAAASLRGQVTVLRTRVTRRAWASAVAYLLFMAAAWRWTSGRIVRPIQELSHAAQEARRPGQRFVDAGHGPSEVRGLRSNFGSLVGDLEHSRSHLEEKVVERTAELERAIDAKSTFVARMSHEVRTPMNSILGFAELLEESRSLGREEAEYVGLIHSSGRHLLALLNEILDISKIDAGKMTLEVVPFSPLRLFEEVVESMRIQATARGIGLELVRDPELPDTIASDPLRVRQVLVNLIGNAIKFTEQGSVTVRVSWFPESTTQGILKASVEDTGVGIPEDKLGAIFEAFSQADESTTRRFGGTGLGLAISRELSELLGGSLHVESEEGKGSRFDVRIRARQIYGEPTAALPGAGEEAERDEALALQGRVLVADDVEVNRRLIAIHLRRAGLEVELVNDGKAACQAVRAARENGAPFDLLLVDLQMPVLDGVAAVRRLRNAGINTPIVALTANAQAEARASALRTGFDDYLTKPIVRDELRRVLQKFLSARV